MGTTAERCVWDGRESRQDGPGARTKLVVEPPAAGDQGLGLGSGNEPIGRTKSRRTRRAARRWAGLPRALTTGGSRAGGRLQQRLEAPTDVRRWMGRKDCLCLSCDSYLL